MKDKKTVTLSIVGLVLLVIATIGVSYAIFNYAKAGATENTVTVGNLKFLYTEISGIGNGISITEALPVSDVLGKAQTGVGKVFDFKVEANTPGNAAIPYEITAYKESSSTLNEDFVKLYLTEVSGSVETETPLTLDETGVKTYNNLANTKIKNGKGKTIYTGEVPENTTNYLKTFKVRMWIDEKADFATGDHNGKNFTLKINVYANALNDEYRLPTFTDDSGANAPELLSGMIPVVYNEDKSSWVKADVENGYYDYANQVWANAVTVNDASRSKYSSAIAGTVISMNDINSMLVWIPRYEYQYTNLEKSYAGGTKELPGEIKINFIPKTQTVASDASTYKIPSAFSFDGVEKSGMWVSKFEISGSLTTSCVNDSCDIKNITSKPNQVALSNQTVSSFFYLSRSLQGVGNPFGFTTDLDTHMIKNSEWASVAYLSQSKYGKYGNTNFIGSSKEIYQNKSSSFMTGSSNGTGSTDTSNTQVTYDVKGSGTGASTTGTIYGIYDMSGGLWEYTMANYSTLSNNVTISDSLFIESTLEEKYFDRYENETANVACASGICYSHALSETEGWYSDYSVFTETAYPWLLRGGNYSYNTGAGVFAYSSDTGKSNNQYGSRFVIYDKK